MKELSVFIKSLLVEKKSTEEILEDVSVKFKDSSDEEILEALEVAQKSIKLTQGVADRAAEKESAEKMKSVINDQVSALVEEKLASIKLKTHYEDQVQVKTDWVADAAIALSLSVKVAKKQATSSEHDEFIRVSQVNLKRWDEKIGVKATDSIISGTSTAGGAFMPPEFDAEIDKLVYKKSALLTAIKMRPGGEKTEINSISTFNFTYRTDENTAFATTRPTTATQEVLYKDAGAIIGISNRALQGSYYNIISELVELGADAKIRLLEPLLTTGSIDVDSDAFDGIRFHTGVATLNCANNGGSGRVLSSDLTNLWLTAPSQSRAGGVFIMDSREAMLLAEEKDSNGQKLRAVDIVNGEFVHTSTGKKIIVVDTMHRLCNGVTDRSTGTDVPVLFANLEMFRYYELGGLRIDMSKEFYYDFDQTGMRFILANKFGIPTQARTSFVTLQGVKTNTI